MKHFSQDYFLNELGEIAQKIRDVIKQGQTEEHATLVTFTGDLGAGKTTLIQELAYELGVVDHLPSPTFVIYKRYEIPGKRDTVHDSGQVDTAGDRQNAGQSVGQGNVQKNPWKYFIHGDMYRLERASDIEKLGWSELLKNPENLLCIEWPEKIDGAIPDWAIAIQLRHLGGDKRRIEI